MAHRGHSFPPPCHSNTSASIILVLTAGTITHRYWPVLTVSDTQYNNKRADPFDWLISGGDIDPPHDPDPSIIEQPRIGSQLTTTGRQSLNPISPRTLDRVLQNPVHVVRCSSDAVILSKGCLSCWNGNMKGYLPGRTRLDAAHRKPRYPFGRSVNPSYQPLRRFHRPHSRHSPLCP